MHKFNFHFLYYYHSMNHYHYIASDCKILYVDPCCFVVNRDIQLTIQTFHSHDFNNISRTVLFLSNNEVVTFLKQAKIELPYHSKHMKGFKLWSVQQLQAVVSSSTASQIPLFRYISVYKIFAPLWKGPLQIFAEEELKLPVLLFVIIQISCWCCCSCLKLMALFTVTFIKKMQFSGVLFSQSKLISHFVAVFTLIGIDRDYVYNTVNDCLLL